ncbi:MAG: hypothetical protein WCA52_14965, partial [Candidatus Aquilonibacter sp.]
MIGPPPIDISRAVRTELAVPGRYHLEKALPAHRSLFGLIFQWLYDRWNDLWNALSSHIKIGPTGASIIGDVLVVACVLAIALIGAHLLVRFEYERTRRERAIGLTQPRSAHALAALAAQA